MNEEHHHDHPLDLDYEPPLPAGERRKTPMLLIVILSSVALAAVAQLVLKHGMSQVGAIGREEVREPLSTVVRIAATPAVWGGFVLFAVSALLWLVVLSRASLSFAYPFASLTYVLILVFDRVVLKEPISATRYGGVALIIAGLLLISRTGQG